jgi:hypothetical protein
VSESSDSLHDVGDVNPSGMEAASAANARDDDDDDEGLLQQVDVSGSAGVVEAATLKMKKKNKKKEYRLLQLLCRDSQAQLEEAVGGMTYLSADDAQFISFHV